MLSTGSACMSHRAVSRSEEGRGVAEVAECAVSSCTKPVSFRIRIQRTYLLILHVPMVTQWRPDATLPAAVVHVPTDHMMQRSKHGRGLIKILAEYFR